MKKVKIISRLLCIILWIHSLLSSGGTVFATEEVVGNTTAIETMTSSFSEKTEKEMVGELLETVESSSEIFSNSESEIISESRDPIEEQLSNIIAEGEYGSVVWKVTKDGILTLEEGILPNIEKGHQTQSPWIDFSEIIQNIDIRGVITSTDFGAESLFSGLTNLKKINNLNKIDLSEARSIRHLFSFTNIQQLYLPGCDVSRVEDFAFVFKGLNLKGLDLSNWYFSKDKNLENIFDDVKPE
ncbi:hypothetical protein ACWOEJ_11395 [Enterococcus eurekensis]|uniref:Uncharacterized protein n=1 Tax=Enterococcus eurekensis TaxID=1159753 RepID=A0ABV9M407_9ENTE